VNLVEGESWNERGIYSEVGEGCLVGTRNVALVRDEVFLELLFGEND